MLCLKVIEHGCRQSVSSVVRYTLYTYYSNSGTVKGMRMQLVPLEQPQSAQQNEIKCPCTIFIAEVFYDFQRSNFSIQFAKCICKMLSQVAST